MRGIYWFCTSHQSQKGENTYEKRTNHGNAHREESRMTALALSIATGTWIAVVFKLINRSSVRADCVICVNYVAASVLTLFSYLRSAGFSGPPNGLGTWFPVLIGSLLGMFMRANLMYTEKSTMANGVGSTTFFNRIGFFPCVLLTAVLWREIPTTCQCAGLILVILSMLEMLKSLQGISLNRISTILFLMGSTTSLELMNRLFSRYCVKEQKPLFLLAAFLTALAISLAVIRKKHEGTKLTRDELLLGLALGIPNTLNNSFKLKSMETLSATTVFASFAVGTMVLSVAAGAILFHEKIRKRTWFSMLLAAISIVLVNL